MHWYKMERRRHKMERRRYKGDGAFPFCTSALQKGRGCTFICPNTAFNSSLLSTSNVLRADEARGESPKTAPCGAFGRVHPCSCGAWRRVQLHCKGLDLRPSRLNTLSSGRFVGRDVFLRPSDPSAVLSGLYKHEARTILLLRSWRTCSGTV